MLQSPILAIQSVVAIAKELAAVCRVEAPLFLQKLDETVYHVLVVPRYKTACLDLVSVTRKEVPDTVSRLGRIVSLERLDQKA